MKIAFYTRPISVNYSAQQALYYDRCSCTRVKECGGMEHGRVLLSCSEARLFLRTSCLTLDDKQKKKSVASVRSIAWLILFYRVRKRCAKLPRSRFPTFPLVRALFPCFSLELLEFAGLLVGSSRILASKQIVLLRFRHYVHAFI